MEVEDADEVVAAAIAFSVDSSATTATVACVGAAMGAWLVDEEVEEIAAAAVEDEVEAASAATTGAGVSTTATGEDVLVTSGTAEEVGARVIVL